MDGIAVELEEVGIVHTGIQDCAEVSFPEGFSADMLDPEVGAVVCGYDSKFTYHKLALAALYLQSKRCRIFFCLAL